MFSEPGQPLLFYSFSHKLGITHNQNNFTFFGNVDVIYKHIELEEAVAIRCSVKKVFLEILQNSQKNTSARVSSLHQCLRAATLLKKRLWHRRFPLNFVKFLRTPVFREHHWWLLLNCRWH